MNPLFHKKWILILLSSVYLMITVEAHDAKYPYLRRLLPNQSNCKCQSSKRPCLFIHGAGVPQEFGVQQQFQAYWGEITQVDMPCCSSISYTIFDTKNFPWTDSTLQEKVCDAALSIIKPTIDKKVLNDIILVSHSMGNLLVAGAVANGRCSFGKNYEWIALQGPMDGSLAAEKYLISCLLLEQRTNSTNQQNNFTATQDLELQEIIQVVNSFGGCPASPATESLIPPTSSLASSQLQIAYQQAQNVYGHYVTAAMCGVTTEGLTLEASEQLRQAAQVAGFLSPSDGLVEFNSCSKQLEDRPWKKIYNRWYCPQKKKIYQSNRWYKANINHEDGAFRNGNDPDPKKRDRQPKKWLQCLL